jgi:hypothetical protein
MAMIETTLQDGTVVLIEVEAPAGLRQVGGQEVINKIEGVMSHASQTAVSLAAEFATRFRGLQDAFRPSSASLQLGIKIGAQGGVVLTKASAEANLVVTLTWELSR